MWKPMNGMAYSRVNMQGPRPGMSPIAPPDMMQAPNDDALNHQQMLAKFLLQKQMMGQPPKITGASPLEGLAAGASNFQNAMLMKKMFG